VLVVGCAQAADRIEVDIGGCDAGVHLVAHGATLTDVLTRLSTTLGFELEVSAWSDSLVDVDATRQAPELVARLASLDSLIVSQAKDPRCPGRYKIVKVWMLPKARAVGSDRAKPASGPRQLSDVERRQIRNNEEAYRRAHGLPLVVDEDDASK
jgi:hypothetical protein